MPKCQRRGLRIRSCLSGLFVILFALNSFDCGGSMNLIKLEILVEVPVAHILVVDTCEELPGRVMLPVEEVAS